MKFLAKKVSFFIYVTLFIICFPILINAQSFKPTDLPNLKVWLAAADTTILQSGGYVSQWTDKSGNSYNAVQLTQASKPIYVTNIINGKSILRFDGVDDYLDMGNLFSINNNLTFFVVFNTQNNSLRQSIFSQNDAANAFQLELGRNPKERMAQISGSSDAVAIASGAVNNQFELFTYRRSGPGATHAFFWNGQSLTLTSNLTNNFSGNGVKNIGRRTPLSQQFKGDIAEIIIYGSTLSETDRTNVESYLWQKYFMVPVNLGPDIYRNHGFCDTVTLDAGSGYNSYHWSPGGASTRTIKVTNSGQYSVTVTDSHGFPSSDAINVYFPNVSIHDTLICIGNIINVSPHMQGNYTYLWSPSSATTPSINISNAGTYSVTVYDSIFCHKSATFHLAVDSLSHFVNLGGDTLQSCSGNLIGLISGANRVNHYLWSPGGDTTSQKLITPTSHWYKVQASDNNCTAYDSIYVHVFGTAPIPDFNITNTCSGDSTTFHDLSTGPDGVNSWNWNIAGIGSSISPQPSFMFNTAGIYTLNFTVGSPTGCFKEITQQFTIKKGVNAAFTHYPICTIAPALFMDTTNIPSGESLLSSNWYINGIFASAATQAPLLFPSTGTYDVSLVDNLTNGCRDSISKIVNALDNYPSPTPFNLILPHYNQIENSNDVLFSWNTSQNALRYKLVITSDALLQDTIFHNDSIFATSYSVVLTPAQHYYWNVTALNPCGNQITSTVSRFTVFNPNVFSNLNLWLAADQGVTIPSGNAVSQWNDLSGNNNNASQVTLANRPSIYYNILNGKPVLRFNGSTTYLSLGNTFNIFDSLTFFTVFTTQNNSLRQSIFSQNDTTNAFQLELGRNNRERMAQITGLAGPAITTATNAQNNQFEILTYKRNGPGASNSFRWDGQLLNLSTNSSNPYSKNGVKNIGRRAINSQYLLGDIAEILIFGQPLADSNRIIVENYLRYKYFPASYIPPINLGPDIYVNYGFCATLIQAPTGYKYHWSTSTSDTLSYIMVNEPGAYWVTATDNFGYVSYDTIHVFYPNHHIDDTLICYGKTFTATLGLTATYHYSWSTTETTPSINISHPGHYSLIISDSVGNCSKIVPFNVAVDSLAYYVNLGNFPLNLCAGNKISLISGAGFVDNYLWSPGGQTDSIKYIDTSGTYSVQVFDNHGCSAKDSILVNISGTAPTPHFSKTDSCTGNNIIFHDLSAGPDGVNHWNWIIVGIDTSILAMPTFVFDTAGIFTLKFTVGSPTGCYKDTIAQFEVHKGIEAGFIHYPICTGEPALFMDTTHIPSGEILLNRNWYIDDNNVSTASHAPLLFNNVGISNVSLVVNLTNGCGDSIFVPVNAINNYLSPTPFNLILPHYNQIENSNNIQFSWNTSQNAIRYKLIVTSDSLLQDTIFHNDTIFATSFSTVLPQAQNYYWHVTALNPCGNLITSVVSRFTVFNSNTFSDLKLWLAADEGVVIPSGNAVMQWNDLSGNNNNASQVTLANRPSIIYNVLNGKPVLRYNGSSSYLDLGNTFSIHDSLTFFVVFNTQNNNLRQSIFSQNDAANAFQLEIGRTNRERMAQISGFAGPAVATATSAQNDQFEILTYRRKDAGASNSFHRNGDSLHLTINTNNVFTGNGVKNIGRRAINSQYLKGDIAEIIFYGQPLSETNRIVVESYLRYKYFPASYIPPVNLGPDIHVNYGFCDTTISPLTLGYNHYYWSTGDTTSFITVNEPGKYWVKATDNFGYISYDTIQVFYPFHLINDTVLCYNETFNANLGLTGNYTYVWSTTVTTPSINITHPGQYWVSVTDSMGICSKTDTFNVAVDSLAYYLSLGTYSSLCIGNELFVQQGNAYVNSYLWSPGGATTPEITITHPAMYVLQATSINQCVAKDSINVTNSDSVPHINFSINGSCQNDSIYFTDLSYASGGINSWLWQMGTQNTSILPNPVIKFDTARQYPLYFMVRSIAGCTKDTMAYFPILPSPKADFIYFPTCETVSTIFVDNSVIPYGYSLDSREWYINNNYIGNQDTLIYTFYSIDTFLVSLNININNLCQDIVQKQIIVLDSYSQPETFSLVNPPNNLTVNTNTLFFEWNSSANAVKYKLKFASDVTFSNPIYISDFIFSTSHQTTLPLPQIFYWRVEAFNPCNDSIPSEIRTIYQFNPTYFGGLKLWFAADEGVEVPSGNSVSQWSDLSGNHFNATQLSPSYCPTIIDNVLNGKPAIHFDGINDYLDLGNPFNIYNKIAFFVIYRTSNNNLRQSIFSQNDAIGAFQLELGRTNKERFANITNNLGPAIATAVGAVNNKFELLSYSKNGTGATNSFHWNGQLLNLTVNQDTNYTGNGIKNIGRRTVGSQQLKGDIAEIIIYDSILTDTQRVMVERYLMDKYQPPVSLGPDINMPNSICDTSLHVGNGYAAYHWSTGDSTEAINVIEPGTYWVRVTDIFGRISSDTVVVVKPEFHVSDTTICFGTSVVYNLGGGNIYHYLWSDGETTPSVNLHNQGNYWVSISDSHCHKDLSFNIAYDNYPHFANLGSHDSTICSGANIHLINGANETTTYLWSTGDTLPAISIVDSGGYTLDSWNYRGCHLHDSIFIHLKGYLPTANFSAPSVCAGNMMNFTDNSSSPNDPVGYWYWIFGPGDFANGNQTGKTFLTPGYHNVKLIVTTAKSCHDTIVKPVLVWDKPVINFTPIYGCKGTPINFNANSNVLYGTILTSHWKFGDGTSAWGSTIPHTYTTEGNYDVWFTAKSTHYCIDSLKKSIDVRTGPEVDFDYTNACYGQEIQFSNTTPLYPWGEIIEQSWDFGDNTQSLLINPSHTFIDSAGIYNVRLKEKSINGCIVTKIKPVKVSEIPNADFVRGNACANVPFQFFDASTVNNDNIVHWQWNFDNLATDTIRNPFFTFPAQGIYSVYLDVTTSAGCSNYISYDDIEVYPSPKADFTLSPQYGISPLTVNFTNNSTPMGEITSVWNFGDNFVSNSSNPTHTFTQNGIYHVELTVSNTSGCSNSAFGTVNVIPTVIDIAVDKVKVEIIDNYVKVTVTLRNYGTQTLNKLDLIATGSNGMTFRERWQDTITPGESKDYVLSSQFLINNQVLDYVCVKAVTLELGNDIDLSNNENCQAVTNDFTVINAFPNPANQEVNLNVIIPSDDVVDITLYNTDGQLIANIFNGQLVKGLNRFTVNLSGISKGVYSFVVNYHDKQIITKFVKF